MISSNEKDKNIIEKDKSMRYIADGYKTTGRGNQKTYEDPDT